MDNTKILSMQGPILVSWVNMKLRNEFSSLDRLTTFFELSAEELNIKLADADVAYNKELNQFR